MIGFAIGVELGGDPIDDQAVSAVAGAFPAWAPPATIDRRGPATVISAGAPMAWHRDLLVVADARLDQPESSPPGALTRAPGVDPRQAAASFLARAWSQRGEKVLDELDGDFAFVVWDRSQHRLCAARDRFGVRPVYFTELASAVWLSTLPSVLLAIPGLDHRLDELGVLDHLLFDRCREPHGTVWRGVRRLPPGRLRWWGRGRAGERTWRRDLAGPAQVPETGEGIAAQIMHLLDGAVARRLPADGRVAVWMSGGLDSTAVASSVAAVGGCPEAHTVSYRRLIPDTEGSVAAAAAAHLGIRHRRHDVDRYRLFERWQDLPRSPLPGDPAVDAMYFDIDRRALEHSGVALTGFGGDPLLIPDRGWWLQMLSQGRPLTALCSGWRSWRSTGRRPPLGMAGRLARRAARRRWRQGFPPWLAHDFAARTGALERWRHFRLEDVAPSSWQKRRGEARRQVLDDGWSHLFERLDADLRGVAISRRHPFFDARLVEFMLSLETLPWCLDKWALRLACRGRLPPEVHRRAKTPLAGDPWPGVSRPFPELWQIWSGSAPELAEFIDVEAVAKTLGSPGDQRAIYRRCGQALSFACWRSRWKMS